MHDLRNTRPIRHWVVGTLTLVGGLLALRRGSTLLRRPTTEPSHYADAQSRFVRVRGINIHYQMQGSGSPVLLLVHGSFLSLLSWREVFTPLAESATVIALDRPAFGLTERRVDDSDPSPDTLYTPEGQADILIDLLDQLGIQQDIILVGSSTGGTIAILAALRHPHRIRGLILVDAMVYSGYPVSDMPAWLLPTLRRWRLAGRLLVRAIVRTSYRPLLRSFWFDATRLDPAILATYQQSLEITGWDAALWELILATHHLHLTKQLQSIQIPVVVITGEHDHTVPTRESVQLAEALPNAQLVILPDCAHLPHEECPEPFLAAVRAFLSERRFVI